MTWFRSGGGSGGAEVNIDGVPFEGDVLNLVSEEFILNEYASTLPYDFYYGCAVVYENEIHILGGKSNSTGHYKWNGTSWTQVSTLPYSFNYGRAVVLNNDINIMGGYSTSNYDKHYLIEKLRYNIA